MEERNYCTVGQKTENAGTSKEEDRDREVAEWRRGRRMRIIER